MELFRMGCTLLLVLATAGCDQDNGEANGTDAGLDGDLDAAQDAADADGTSDTNVDGDADVRPWDPIRLHPDNGHYFLFRGEPAVLITSAEHYGAVLNLDFDFLPYLEELREHGLNQTRTFSGTYREIPGTFGISGNTLAPSSPDAYACPWARSSEAGAGDGGNKFDLDTWDEAYFDRLRSFVSEAAAREVVVELVLFCPFYNDALWEVSPMNGENNINGVGHVPRRQALDLDNDGLLAHQEALVQRIVEELNEFDNLYYEVTNEPYAGDVPAAWEDHIIATIVDREASLPRRHLIAQNIANGSATVTEPNPDVSIFNFHYATPPDAVALNYGLDRVIGDDETGFDGSEDLTYRGEGWDFILAGGGVYSNLDYSFTPDREDGTAVPDAPGGGGAALRGQLRILSEFIHGLDFVQMTPDNDVIVGGIPSGATARALVEPGRTYAIYVRGGTEVSLDLDLPAGTYRAEWISTRTGEALRTEDLDHPGGVATVASPPYSEDIAVRIVRP
jgi:hypothetical protein